MGSLLSAEELDIFIDDKVQVSICGARDKVITTLRTYKVK